jgi:serine/threonine protein kinase
MAGTDAGKEHPSVGRAVRAVAHPERIGPYRILGDIGTGGFSRVYRAEREGSRGWVKQVALKVLDPSIPATDDLRHMFIDEASIARHLHHRNVVPVHEFGVEDGLYYLVMDFVDGLDLRSLLRRLRAGSAWIPIPAAVDVAVEVLHGLHHAHTRKDEEGVGLRIVHRDVSPGNVLLSTEGSVKLTDFGLARIRHKIAVTEVGTTRGTTRFMSPEQARGLPVDGRSDIFAVGTLLYLMLTERAPFSGVDDAEVMRAVVRCEPKPLLVRNPRLPRDLVRVVGQLMARDPGHRFSSALGAAEALAAVAEPDWGGRQDAVLARLVNRMRSAPEPDATSQTLKVGVPLKDRL